MVATYNELYLDIRRRFIDAGISSPELEAREIVCAVFGKTKEEYYKTNTLLAPPDGVDKCLEWAKRRCDGCPLAYILESWEFFGIPLHITPDVLIPRADTEVIVSAVILDYKKDDKIKILDLCCGSGCIGIALAENLPDAFVCLADKSHKALALAERNVRDRDLKSRCVCVYGDVTEPPEPVLGTFDVIVCNPPYISTAEVEMLDYSVRGFEPHSALDGGYDGLGFIRQIANNWKTVVRPSGRMYMECGAGQAGSVGNILAGAGWQDAVKIKDLAGIERVVRARIA